ncbi:hypothetical protein FPZ43_03345 [Mucilaginibacter pallidiroseus]|uniref:Glycosyltransferase RgtA/B/C/D-like domain-containing protein n=1 Tax=Mucilaginibacter pallidiroseus TaxID=2599295 RepID=A0A563UJK0_9SPHI|nr:hypothetical protein FPZ43_03345 [Mucilaginibacter pallidiroseus]
MLLFINAPAVFPDPSWGLQVMKSMQRGYGFNNLVLPAHENIATNASEFLTWWSPGQYLLPYLFTTVFKLKLAHAIAATILLCQAVGLVGFYRFFTKAGFNQNIALMSLLFIVAQQAFFGSFIFYTGGEILLFAFCGWFLYGCLSFSKPGVTLAIFVFACGLLGFVCKSSFIWMYAAGLLSVWIILSNNTKKVVTWLTNGIWIGIPAVASVLCIFFFFLSKGSSPVTEKSEMPLTVNAVTYPLASPLLSGFSADDLANGLVEHNNKVLFSPDTATVIVAVLAVLSLALIYAIVKAVNNSKYKVVLLSIYAISILFFGTSYLRSLNISYESRHFRNIGLLVTPGLIYVVLNTGKVAYKYAFVGIASVILFFSVRFYILSSVALNTEVARGATGIAHQFADQPSVDYIGMLDRKSSNATFVFFSPDLPLEIQHNRAITMDPINGDMSFDLDASVYKGHAGPLYILMPHNYIGIRASMILKCFPGYKGFSLKELSDDYVLYYAIEAR